MHPLFGPTEDFDGKNLAFIPLKTGPKTRQILVFLAGLGINVFETSIDEHDREVAITQGLFHHVMNFFEKNSDSRFHTSNFCRVVKNPELVKELFEMNCYAKEKVQDLTTTLKS